MPNFSHTNYIPMLDGDVQCDYLWPSSNLSEFISMVDETEKLSVFFLQSYMCKLLEVDTEHLRTLLSVLKMQPKIVRNSDF